VELPLVELPLPATVAESRYKAAVARTATVEQELSFKALLLNRLQQLRQTQLLPERLQWKMLQLLQLRLKKLQLQQLTKKLPKLKSSFSSHSLENYNNKQGHVLSDVALLYSRM
jgi:hypothetical protein